jgi:ADP-ribose pyrophosphatase YjhB (NUDIX family)
MFEKKITHHIQKHIIGVLYTQKVARFRDLREKGTDTNLFAYHLKLLTKNGMVEKVDGGYTLGTKGLTYVDRVSEESMSVRTQPKIVTMLVIQNSNGDVLLWKRNKQPYIDTWTLPYGKLHIGDVNIQAAVMREVREKLSIDVAPQHAGDCYIHVVGADGILSSTLAHIFRYETDDIHESERITWVRPHKLAGYDLAPAVEQIVTRTFFHDPYFFEEFDVTW